MRIWPPDRSNPGSPGGVIDRCTGALGREVSSAAPATRSKGDSSTATGTVVEVRPPAFGTVAELEAADGFNTARTA